MPTANDPRPLACLRTSSELLLVEVMDIVIGAHGQPVCWARPLALRTGNEQMQDVRQAPDLLWPDADLETVLDVEILPMLSLFAEEVLFPDSERTAHLMGFIKRFCAERQGLPQAAVG